MGLEYTGGRTKSLLLNSTEYHRQYRPGYPSSSAELAEDYLCSIRFGYF